MAINIHNMRYYMNNHKIKINNHHPTTTVFFMRSSLSFESSPHYPG